MFLTEVKSGAKTVVGAKHTLKIIVAGNAKIAAVADNASVKVIEPLERACAESKTPLEHIATMEALGKACGIRVGASAAVILKS